MTEQDGPADEAQPQDEGDGEDRTGEDRTGEVRAGSAGPWRGSDGAPGLGRQVGTSMRAVLTLASAARVAMARRMRISLNDLQAIEHVMTAEGPGRQAAVGPSELARRLGVTTAATTQSLHRLEALGHVRRRPHPDDRRRQVVEVTPEGAEDVFAVLSPLLRRVEAQTARLTPDEQRAVLTYLQGQQEAYEEFLAELAASPADRDQPGLPDGG